MKQQKLVIVINGKGGVGKDTFCKTAAQFYPVRTVSAITPVKVIARQCGWDGEKDLKARRFLASLKRLLAEYNGYPNFYLERRYQEFLEDEKQLILFVHIREADQIQDFLRRVDGKKATLLIRSKHLGQNTYGNAADDEAEAFDYDYEFHNDCDLEQLPQVVHAFLADLLCQEGIRR
jgi:hypothetical protein